MTISNIRNWTIRIVVLFVILGLPFIEFGGLSALSGSQVDSVSSASTFVFDNDDVNGSYYIYINRKIHSDHKTAKLIGKLFQGEDVPLIMDDINVLVCKGDVPAREYADICKARLPENQMTVRAEDTILALSKLDFGKFDSMIISREYADNYNVDHVNMDYVMRVIKK